MKTTALSLIAAVPSREAPPVVGIQRRLVLMPGPRTTAGPLLCLALVVGIIAAVAPARAHELPAEQQIQLTVATWANGRSGGDTTRMAEVMSERFMDPLWGNKAAYLALVPGRTLPVERISLRHAQITFDEARKQARVSPVVFESDSLKGTLTLVLEREGERWLIVATESGPELPREFTDPRVGLPLHPVRVTVRDAATREPIVTRVHVSDAAGTYWPPEGHRRVIPTALREEVGGDVRVGTNTFAYVEPSFTLPLPEGRYRMEVARGMEYEPGRVEFEVRSNRVPTLAVSMRRWSHLSKQGWYSGDTHVHFIDPTTAHREMAGEDLNVVNLLASRWGELTTGVEHFTGGPSAVSTRDHVVYVNEEARHGFLGHLVLLNLKQLVHPMSWGGPLEGLPGESDYPPVSHHADVAHAQGGLVSWAHFPGPTGEVAQAVALGKIDAVDLMTFGNPMEDQSMAPAATKIWYRMLNCGFRLPALGGTDKMMNSQVVGSVRTYVKVNGTFSYQRWIDGIRAGRTFTTTGPVLSLSANGRGLGETVTLRPGALVTVRAAVQSFHPVERLEIVLGGKVVATKTNATRSRSLTLDAPLTPTESSWVAARAYASDLMPYQILEVEGLKGIPSVAHTSPVYLVVDGKPTRSREDAAFLLSWCDSALDWAKTKARLDPSQREDVVALFERARRVYLQQMKEPH